MNSSDVRELFPITRKWLYFNASSLSPYCTPVLLALEKFKKERMDNGSLHFDDWYEDIEVGRELAAKITGGNVSEIALTKNTSEGINLVALLLDWKKGDNVVLSEMDFPANIYPFLNLEKKGVEVRYIKSNSATILPEDVEREIDENTKLVSLSHVFFNNGFRIDIEKIGEICQKNGTHFHVDATQSLGVVPTDVKKAKVDFLSVGAYKWLLSPLGSGFVYINSKFLDHSPILGWLSVKDPLSLNVHDYEILDSAGRFEVGNPDVGAFLGMRAALELIDSIGVEKIEKKVLSLSSMLTEELTNSGFETSSDFEDENRSGIVSFNNFGITKEDLIKNKIIATVRDYIRLSPHIYNTEDEIEEVVKIIEGLRQ